HGAGRLQRHRHVLRRRTLALRRVRSGGIRRVRRDLLLVPEVHRPDDGRATRQSALLAVVHRFQHDVPRPAPARPGRDAAASRDVPRERWLRQPQPDLDDRLVHHRRERAVLRVESVAIAAPRTPRRQRPVGRPDARVGDYLAAARAELRLAAPDPLGAAVLRPEVRRPRQRVGEDMKVESFFYLGVTAFFVVIGAIYWFTSYEDAGTTMLVASSLLGLLAGGYLLLQARKFPPRPEDRPDATLAESAGPVDQFPASTIWPFVFAFGAAVFATGFVFGVWVILGGAIVLVLGVIGMIRQSRDTSPTE